MPFRLELLRTTFNQQAPPVTVSTVEDDTAHDLVATPAMFEIAPSLPQLGKVSLPLSGFRLVTQMNSKKIWDEFLVFQGASYFRGVAKGLLYGLSARGLAINTAEPAGEEFPAFTHFWVEQPAPHATSIVIDALLESESITGAYRFTVQPGAVTVMDVTCTLFPRSDLRVVGIAPLTSMFLFDETNRGRLDDYRPEVHDSDGLQITSSTGEHIFRQLANPTKLQVSTFTTRPPAGFGLVQRSRDQSDFEDFEDLYERRPSAWIEPKGDWGPGAVELVEIPSGRESNDNIVAFWRPAQGLAAGHPAEFAYRLSWLAEPDVPKGLGEVMATRSGASLDGKRRVFVLDIVGAGDKTNDLSVDLSASAGKISNVGLDVEHRDAGPARELRDRPEQCGPHRDAAADHARRSPGERDVAVPMDAALSSAVRIAAAESSGGMPPRRDSACPRRISTMRRRVCRRGSTGSAVWFARIILVAAFVGITTYGVYQMLQVVRFASMTFLQGTDDLFLRRIPRMDRIFRRLGTRRRLQAPRSAARPVAGRPGGRARRDAHRSGHADLQRGSHAHHGGAASHGRGAAARPARVGVSRSSCFPTRPTPMPGSARRRPSSGCAARSPACCPSGTGDGGATSRARRAISRTSSHAGAAATIT